MYSIMIKSPKKQCLNSSQEKYATELLTYQGEIDQLKLHHKRKDDELVNLRRAMAKYKQDQVKHHQITSTTELFRMLLIDRIVFMLPNRPPTISIFKSSNIHPASPLGVTYYIEQISLLTSHRK
jgi:hypothetical protein